MSGGQTPSDHFGKQLKDLKNFNRGTTCQCHIPYVVADVVPDVEGAGAVETSEALC
jgi:hypothetical protein